jgi:hypothetical protein
MIWLFTSTLCSTFVSSSIDSILTESSSIESSQPEDVLCIKGSITVTSPRAIPDSAVILLGSYIQEVAIVPN